MTDAVAERPEVTYYSPIVDGEMQGLERFDPESFVPLKGTVLVVLAPMITKSKAGLDLPDTVHERPGYARVAAIPREEDLEENLRQISLPGCPVSPGDIVIFRTGAPVPINFGDRDDLALLNYAEGPESDIMGIIPANKGLSFSSAEEFLDKEDEISQRMKEAVDSL